MWGLQEHDTMPGFAVLMLHGGNYTQHQNHEAVPLHSLHTCQITRIRLIHHPNFPTLPPMWALAVGLCPTWCQGQRVVVNRLLRPPYHQHDQDNKSVLQGKLPRQHGVPQNVTH